jgi:intein/homing endonuclease
LSPPIKVQTRGGIGESSKIWYNGEAEVYDIEFEDGNVYSYTGNHKLLVKLPDQSEVWRRVDELTGEEDVVCV